MTKRRSPHAALAMTLSFEFQKYLTEHPEMARRIPRDATVIFQLDAHPSFNKWARAMAQGLKGSKREVITVRVRSMNPPVSRIKSVELVS